MSNGSKITVMTDNVKEALSLLIWVKWQLLVKKDLCHLRALSLSG